MISFQYGICIGNRQLKRFILLPEKTIEFQLEGYSWF